MSRLPSFLSRRFDFSPSSSLVALSAFFILSEWGSTFDCSVFITDISSSLIDVLLMGVRAGGVTSGEAASGVGCVGTNAA